MLLSSPLREKIKETSIFTMSKSWKSPRFFRPDSCQPQSLHSLLPTRLAASPPRPSAPSVAAFACSVAVPPRDCGSSLLSDWAPSAAAGRAPQTLPRKPYTPGATLSPRCHNTRAFRGKSLPDLRHTPARLDAFIPLVSSFSHCFSPSPTTPVYFLTGLFSISTLRP